MENLVNYHKKTTNKELFLDFKETYLNLQRALLKSKMYKEMKEVGDNYGRVKESFLKKGENPLWDD